MPPIPVQPQPLGALPALRLRIRALTFDLGSSRFLSQLAAWALFAFGHMLALVGQHERCLRQCLLAHRLSLRAQDTDSPTPLQSRIESLLRDATSRGRFTSLAAPADEGLTMELVQRALVLKAPRNDADGRLAERGVLLLTFTHLFGVLAHHVDVRRLTSDYTLVLEPSWAGYALPEILQFAETTVSPVFVMATETRDFSFIERFDERLVPLPFGASDWVDPDVFRPVGGTEKPFDAGYIGFWGAVKRHHALFRALRRLQRPDFRVALIGGAWEGTAEEVAALADSYGVRGQLTFFERLAPSEVSEVIGQCKVSLLLSRKEGSNRGLFESMFAGTPALLLRENLGVRQSYVNAQTGRIVPERELPEALLWFRKHWQEYRPREWALEHISPLATTRKLNDYLRRSAASLGEPWTTDCVPKTNRPEVTYLHAGDRDRMPTVRDVMATYRRSA